MSFDAARAIADAVLLEGYALYPYRANAIKNQYRWAFGILAPKAWSEGGGAEAWWMETQCIVEGEWEDIRIDGLLRFLHVKRRAVERLGEGGVLQEVESLEVNGELHLPWEEGVVRETSFSIANAESSSRFSFPGEREVQEVGSVGRISREMWPVEGRVSLRWEDCGERLFRLCVRLENTTPWTHLEATRQDAMRSSCISTHILLSVSGGSFVSSLDPTAKAKESVEACKNVRAFPVLVGGEPRRDLLLASPIILYDHPQIAPESQGDFFDGTEIDELLVLRTSTLTEEEKRAARATSERTAALLDRVEGISEEEMARLHGAIRERSAPHPSKVPPVGTKVRFQPRGRRTDAQDILYAGCVATVEKVLQDVGGQFVVAVTMDHDPAAELLRGFGRFHYFYVDELEWEEP